MKTSTVLAVSAYVTSALAAGSALAPRQRGGGNRTPPVEVRGNAFWAGNERFYVRGIDYQPGGASDAKDPLSDREVCRRDIERFRELGINTIRVYTIDNSANHDFCMNLLSEAGIYLALDVNTPKYSINRADPAPSYNDVYLQSVFATVEIFQKYDNTLLFFSANEVINDAETSHTAPYIKAVTRDIKAYMKARGLRQVPVGYSAADIEENRFETAEYMNCGRDEIRSDFFAFNDYSWCGDSSFVESGWNQKVKQYEKYSIPLFLSEYGCNEVEREFTEVEALYSDDMTSVYSGGLVYEYTEEANEFGIVELQGNRVSKLEDFNKFRDQLRQNPSPRGDGGFKEDLPPSECPSRSDTWDVDPGLIPAMPEGAALYMEDGAGEGPGLRGSGSQTAGEPSTEEEETGAPSDGGGNGGDGEGEGDAAAGLRIPGLAMIGGAVAMVAMLI